MRYLFISLTIVLFASAAFSQENPDIALYSKVKEGSVYLKIQPVTTDAWYLGRTNGYIIERRNVNGDEGFQRIGEKPLTPLPEEEMEELGSSDPYTAEMELLLYDTEQGVEPAQLNFATLEQKKEELKGRMFLHFYLSF